VGEHLRELGTSPFEREAMLAALPEFLEVHARLPIMNNHGGMRAPHLFAAWFMLRELRPTHVVESGVFKGLGTWLIEQAAPQSRLLCIDPDLSQREYVSPRAAYQTNDFSTTTHELPRETTVLFFDDHQNALERVRLAEALGFRHLIFEDNYPRGHGDCYSLKRALMGEPPPPEKSLVARVKGALAGVLGEKESSAAYLERVLETYFEFPPVVRTRETRWGKPWDEEHYPTPQALLDRPVTDAERPFETHATSYTWICYARLRPAAAP
jgi:hypothetical protein